MGVANVAVPQCHNQTPLKNLSQIEHKYLGSESSGHSILEKAAENFFISGDSSQKYFWAPQPVRLKQSKDFQAFQLHHSFASFSVRNARRIENGGLKRSGGAIS